jgi:TolB-like protein/DNA-binding winged helix-turn-helix (wHTH) protein/Flp pilus assembly protein TadD
METKAGWSPRVSFGVFEMDLGAGELRRQGLKVKLAGQPLQVLALLLERPGQMITREELQKRLWPLDTFVDFEHGLNKAINRIREALGDDADNPRFVETLHRRGYRFIAPVDVFPKQQTERLVSSGESPLALTEPKKTPPRLQSPKLVAAIATLLVVVLLSVALALNLGGVRDRLLSRPSQGRIESIAVLPFENAGNNPDIAYLSDGLAENLINEFSQLPRLRVVPRGIAFQYKGKPIDPVAAGKALNAQAVVTGRVAQVGDRLTVVAELTDVSMVSQIWGKQYQQQLSNIFEVQEDLSRDILGGMRVKLSPIEATRMTRRETKSTTAYHLVLRGRFELNRFVCGSPEEGLQKALQYAEEAVALDPDYAEAYTLLAQTHIWNGREGPLQVASFTKAREAALQTLKLDNSLPLAHAALCSYYVFQWNWGEADKECRQAVELGPENAEAHLYYAWYLYAVGRVDEALVEGKRAMELEPSHAYILFSMGEFYLDSHRFDEAIEALKTKDSLMRVSSTTNYGIAIALFYKGMHTEAIKIQSALAKADPDHGPRLAWMYALDGRKDEARRILATTNQKPADAVALAQSYVALGDKDQAFAQVELS